MFQGVPRALIAFGVVTIAVLEIATRLPDIVLLPEKIDAAIGEYRAKSLQPKVVTTQVEKTEADTRLADAQTQLNAVQQEKTAAETRVAQLQAEVTAAQVAKTKADTELTRMQTALAATQAQKTQADTQLAQAQTDKTRLDTAQEGVGLALTAGIVGMGAKLFGAMSQSPDTQHATSADYTDGVNARNRWNLWLSGLSGSTREGAKFWENVRNDGSGHTCAEGKGWSNADFRSGCKEAKDQLAAVDQYGMTRSDFRAGWDADRGTQQTATTQQATAPAVPQQQAVLPRQQQEAPRSWYSLGVDMHNQWNDWLSSLQGDMLKGAKFWLSVRGDGKAHTCNEAPGTVDHDFLTGCQRALNRLSVIDQESTAYPDFRVGWSSVH